MSQMVTRKSGEEKEKEKGTESPVKDMKKKMAANAEKEKQAAEKSIEKPAEKIEKQKSTEKPNDKQKPAEKPNEKQKPTEKRVEKQTDKQTEKDKKADKTDKVEKNGVEKKPEQKDSKEKEQEKKDDKGEKSGKLQDKKSVEKPKQNGSKVHNGVSDVMLTSNGSEELLNGATVSEEEDQDLIDDGLHDELFPELAYDDSDPEFDPATPDGPSRSLTRRSQAKATRTPETPRPASDKQTDAKDDESKVLKLAETPASTDRKLRSADSPRPESKKEKETKKQEKEKDDKDKQENGERDIEIIDLDQDEEPRKTDTNFSKSRVKVSPYRRSLRHAAADHTQTSLLANYTGNNTTMEMDITESSSFMSEEPSMNDSSYLSGLRNIRGRRSYKPLKEMTIKKVDRSLRSTTTTTITADSGSRPTAPVVGRKRKPLDGAPADADADADGAAAALLSKRMRLLERIAQPFRRSLAAAEIVGINSDLPLTAPVSSPAAFDPESLKTPAPLAPPGPQPEPEAGKRCVLM
ncbi:myb-like protein X isoform X1 [Hyposmocoma kahamanoa]|uniref:myb-like protein X isoform X1 n=1 Tax=Hyposmocoma kahamanoa TaxID=1477025 RepID=UPI000E6D8799|nr:myb-like protein X isoform X1 [Hyposmocoma kahamanoa]